MSELQSDFERIGGASAVEAIMAAFVDALFEDFIIGFLFIGKDRQRLVQHEVEHASRVLGAKVRYTGRPLGQLHQRLRIHRGHFRRRMTVLKNTLEASRVPPDIQTRWLDADWRLEPVITLDQDCIS